MTMPHIEDFSFGNVQVDSKQFTDDVIIYPWAVDDTWWRDEGHVLKPKDIEDALDADPEVLIVGTGAHGRLTITDEVRDELEERGIELVASETPEAVKEYNRLQADRRAVALLHLTC
jgi:hypothetical protein